MDELKALMGESYKEDMTIDDVKNFMKGKKLADLSTGNYVDKNKYQNDINTLNTRLIDANNSLKDKMSDDEKKAAADKAKDDRIEQLEKLLSANTISSNNSIANSSLVEGVNLIGMKTDDKEYNDFIKNIVTEDTEKTTSIAKYVNKLIKDAYEKGKKDSTKDAMGNFGKGNVKGENGGKEVEDLGKQLASLHSNKDKFDYFAKK